MKTPDIGPMSTGTAQHVVWILRRTLREAIARTRDMYPTLQPWQVLAVLRGIVADIERDEDAKRG